MKETGHLRKMITALEEPVRYTLSLDGTEIVMNDLIGHELLIRFTGEIHCKVCGRLTKKSFGQGYCYPDFMNHPENSPCILRPELCEGHMGIGRDVEWEEKHHVQPHVVYLALSSGLKVGVTREQQVPTRWIDQGAYQAIRLAEVPYRQLAGEIEVLLKDHMADKTNWQRMLKNQLAVEDLLEQKDYAAALLPEEYHDYIADNDDITEIHYPVLSYPEKLKSINLDKTPEVSGKLSGIKGQYLMFEDGQVMNMRKHTSYLVELSA